MSDVFDDLAKAFKAGHDAGRSEAADEIEQLREALSAITELFKATEASAQWALSEVQRLREALRPFVCKCEGDWCEKLRFNDDKAKCEHYIARAALGEKE